MRIADSVYHTLRVAMNGKLVFLWKNSMCWYLPSADGELRDFLPAAVDQRQQGARAHQRGEHRSEDAERQHDGKTLDRAGAEDEQHDTRDESGDVRVRDGREGL